MEGDQKQAGGAGLGNWVSLSPTRGEEDMFEEVISTSPKKPALQPWAEQATGERRGLCSWMRRQLHPMTLCRRVASPSLHGQIWKIIVTA